MKALSNLPINDLVPAVNDPDKSDVDWLRKASAEEREQMKVPNPRFPCFFSAPTINCPS